MKRKNFTLIEILGVCALIAILGIIGFGSYTFAMNKSKESATQALLKQVEAGLANIKQECGYYPSTSGNYVVLKFFAEEDESNSNYSNISVADKLAGKFKNFNNDTVADKSIRKAFNKATDAETIAKYVENKELKDAFGNSIYYCFPGKINTTSYDLVSAGPDGHFGSKTTTSGINDAEFEKENGEAKYDDITNF